MTLYERAISNYSEGKRLVAPLMGFPGLNITGSTIRKAQEDHNIHFAAVQTLARRFEPDLIFPMMDLTLEALALGMPALIPEDEPASIPHQTFTPEIRKSMETAELRKNLRILEYFTTLDLMVQKLPENCLKGAYVIGPFTLAALIKGADDTALSIFTDPVGLHDLIEFCAKKIMDLIKLIFEIGIRTICILEPTASLLSPDQLIEFSSHYTSKINDFCKFQEIQSILHICGNTTHLIDAMLTSGINILSLDSADTGLDLPAVAEKIDSDILLIGNLNPTGTILTGSPEEVRSDTIRLLNSMDKYPNYILSTGCDLPKNTPIENIKTFMETGRSYYINNT